MARFFQSYYRNCKEYGCFTASCQFNSIQFTYPDTISMRVQSQSTENQLALISLLLLLVFVYWVALPGPFLLDDFTNLPQAKVESWSLSALIDASLSNKSGLLGRPVSALTFALNYLITGDDTVGFKAVNLAIHAANACLVFMLFSKLAAEVCSRVPVAQIKPSHLALAVAFLWALHPLHVSTVMYVVQRMSLLSTFFMLASMNCYASARLNAPASKILFWGLVTASVVLGLLGVFSKENGALLIAYLILIEWTIFRTSGSRVKLGGQRLGIVLVTGFFVTLMITYPFILRFQRIMSGYELRDFSLNERLLTQPVVVFDYIGQTLFPRIGQMGLYFDNYPLVKELDVAAFWSLMLLFSLVVAFIMLLRCMPLVSLGIGVFLVSHLIESTFLPLEIKFEHRNYFGSIGIVTIVVFALGTSRILLFRRTLAYSLFGVLALLLVSQTFMRSYVWQHELTLNSHEVERAPESKRARSAFAISLSRAGRINEAMAQVQATIVQDPGDTYAPVQLFQICALASSNCSEELKEAYRSLSTGKITMNTVTLLGDLAANNRNGLIEGLSNTQLAGLLSAAAINSDRRLRNTDEAKLQLLLSEEFLETRNLRELTIATQQAVTLDPTNPIILTRAAEIMAGVGSIQEAESVLFRLEAVAPEGVLKSNRVLAVKAHLAKRRKLESEGYGSAATDAGIR